MSRSKRSLILAIAGLLVAALVPSVSSAKRGHVVQPFPAVHDFTKAEMRKINEQWAGKPYSYREPTRDGIALKQPNGKTFVAYLSPAEVGGRLEDATGRTIIKNSKGWWTYAKKGDKETAKQTIQEAIRYAESLPEGQRSDATIASLRKKLETL